MSEVVDPLPLFHAWQREARGHAPPGSSLVTRLRVLARRGVRQLVIWLLRGADLPNADAACLATVDADGQPAGRMVIVRAASEDGFVFFTDGRSDKAVELATQPRAELVFHWSHPMRQVRVRGRVESLERPAEVASWLKCVRSTQVAMIASEQGAPLESRAALEARAAEIATRHRGRTIPCPETYVGFRLVPTSLEFWEGRPDRLHERRRFHRDGESWQLVSLQP